MSDMMGEARSTGQGGCPSEGRYLEADGNQIQRQQDRTQDVRLSKGPNSGVECGIWEVLGNWGWEPLRI